MPALTLEALSNPSERKTYTFSYIGSEFLTNPITYCSARPNPNETHPGFYIYPRTKNSLELTLGICLDQNLDEYLIALSDATKEKMVLNATEGKCLFNSNELAEIYIMVFQRINVAFEEIKAPFVSMEMDGTLGLYYSFNQTYSLLAEKKFNSPDTWKWDWENLAIAMKNQLSETKKPANSLSLIKPENSPRSLEPSPVSMAAENTPPTSSSKKRGRVGDVGMFAINESKSQSQTPMPVSGKSANNKTIEMDFCELAFGN